jgi:hypothetical protein
VALVVGVGFVPSAAATVIKLSGPIVQRPGSVPGNFDFGYRGPQTKVTPWGTSSNTYVCPTAQSISNWVVVADTADSANRWFDAGSSGSGNQIHISVTDWSLTATVHLRAAVSCTTAPNLFPYDPNSCGNFSCPYPPGAYLPYWDGVFSSGAPGVAQYAELIKRAFCWSSTFPGCAAGAPNPNRRLALRNGTNKISLTFRHSSGARPPAVRLSGAAGCTARRADLSVQNRTGNLRLVLRCRGLKRGAAVRVQFVKPLRKSFRLRRGSGSIRVQFAKPAGTVQPLLSLSYGRANRSCRSVRARLRAQSRTFDLRVDARCGRAAGNALANLYVGGLLG